MCTCIYPINKKSIKLNFKSKSRFSDARITSICKPCDFRGRVDLAVCVQLLSSRSVKISSRSEKKNVEERVKSKLIFDKMLNTVYKPWAPDEPKSK